MGLQSRPAWPAAAPHEAALPTSPHHDASAITVLLPLKHYHERFLADAIGSIVTQSSPHWRLLVVVEPDDLEAFGSTLAPWLADARVRIVANQRRGYVSAFNTGMRLADTAFIAILLADDLWASHAVETLLSQTRQFPEVDLFHTGRRVIDSEGRPISSVLPAAESVVASDFIWKSQVKHLICWRRATGLAVGGMDESLKTAGPDDYAFPWTLVERGAVVRAINDCLYIYRDHREGVRHTTHFPRSQHLRDLTHILTKHGVAPTLIRERLSAAKRGYLRQCLYRNELHRRLYRWLGIQKRESRRERYR
jgi:glycosyltransferase involved in cell wall biosynthesis